MLPRPLSLLIPATVHAIAALSIWAADPVRGVELPRVENEPTSYNAPESSECRTLPPSGIRPEVIETFLRMRIVAAVLNANSIEGPIPGPTHGIVPMSWLRQRLPAHRRARVAVRDAWGNPLLYWSDGASYLVLSLGSGGAPQFDYAVDPPYAHISRGWAGSDPTEDLMIIDDIAYRGPMSLGESLRRAMADMRSTGTACEAFSIDTNFYPGPVQPIDAVERVEHVLEPVYIRDLPKIDPWGNPFLFWSDTQGYAIVSYGADGRPDYPYGGWGRAEFETLHSGPTTLPTQDLVFFEGSFLQWPNVGVGP